MIPFRYWSLTLASLAAFVMSSLYYSPLMLGNFWRAIDPSAALSHPSIGKAFVELARTFVVTVVIARLMAMLGSVDWRSRLQLALWLWFGFSAMMWTGAIMWEGTPWQLAAIHTFR